MSEAGTGNHHLPDLHAIREWARKRRAQAPENPGPPKQTLNRRIAVAITAVVGTMWCAYAFAMLAFISLPAAVRGGTATLISWIAQTFLQLVLLSIIMVGQNIAAKKSDRQLEQTYKDSEELLKVSAAIHQLLERNTELTSEIHEVVRTKP